METTLEKPQTEVKAEDLPAPIKPAKISVLITGRKNTKYLAKFMFALFCRTADISNVEILVTLNKGDTWNRELQAFFMAFGLNTKGTIQFFEEDYKAGRDGLHKYFNDMAEFATGDWIVYFCDDHFIEAQGWDQAIRDFATARELDPNKINFIIPKFDNAGTMNHIVSRGAYNGMGQLGRHGWIDSYLNDVMHSQNGPGIIPRFHSRSAGAYGSRSHAIRKGSGRGELAETQLPGIHGTHSPGRGKIKRSYRSGGTMSDKPQLISTKETLKLIALQAAGKNDEFQKLAVEIAYRIDKENTELAQYILAQYKLIPTFEVTD